MKRFLLAACVSLIAVACSGTPGSSPAASVPAPIATAGQAALSQACDSSSSTSIKGVADQLSSYDANSSDTTQLTSALNTLAANLGNVPVSGSQQALKDAAVSAIDNTETALSDPSTAGQAASSAAAALNSLNASLCG